MRKYREQGQLRVALHVTQTAALADRKVSRRQGASRRRQGKQPAFAHHVRKHRRYPLLDRRVRHTIAATSGDGCSAEGTEGMNRAGEFVIGRCFLRLVHFRVQ